MRRLLVVLAAVSACDLLTPEVGDPSPPLDTLDTGPPVLFGRDIRPLIEKSCKQCHYAAEPSHVGLDGSGLDLTTLGSLRHGGNNTRQNIIIPYNPEGSALVLKLYGTFAVGVRMPKTGPPYWSDEDIDLVATWIEQGAKGDDSE
jgi:hypothetical protein